MKSISRSIEETIEIASDFSRRLKGGEIIALQGDLGSGKTHFVKGMAKTFGINEEEVTSPTFSLMQIYEGTKTVVHLDLYRLENFTQVQELGIEDYLETNTIVLVEWADKFLHPLKFDFRVELKKTGAESRQVEIHAL